MIGKTFTVVALIALSLLANAEEPTQATESSKTEMHKHKKGDGEAQKHQHKKDEGGAQKHQHKKGEQHDHTSQKATVTKTGKDKITIKVKGMVCAFCAQGVEKNFNGQKAVKSTNVDLDKMMVHIEFHSGKTLKPKKIEQLITDAGFAYGGVVEE